MLFLMLAILVAVYIISLISKLFPFKTPQLWIENAKSKIDKTQKIPRYVSFPLAAAMLYFIVKMGHVFNWW